MTSGSLKTWKKWSQGVCGRRWRKWMYYQCFLINIKIWCIIRLFVLLCAFVECQCVLAYQTQTHSQDPWELITRRIHCIPKWQLLFNLNALQEGHLVGMFPWEPMTYKDASSYTACRRLWVINYNEGEVYGRVICKHFSLHFSLFNKGHPITIANERLRFISLYSTERTSHITAVTSNSWLITSHLDQSEARIQCGHPVWLYIPHNRCIACTHNRVVCEYQSGYGSGYGSGSHISTNSVDTHRMN